MTAEFTDTKDLILASPVGEAPNEPPRTRTVLYPVMLPSQGEYAMLMNYAKLAAESGCYTGVTNIAKAMQIILKGYHLGIDPMEALMQIVFTGTKMTMQAQLMIALANRSRLLSVFDIPDPSVCAQTEEATVRMVRADREGTYISTFTKADAEKAGLWGKDIWKKYPGAMLVNRAVSAGLRRSIPEVLGGIYLAEEVTEDDDDQQRNRHQHPQGGQRPGNDTITVTTPAAPSLPAPVDEKPWHETEALDTLIVRARDAQYIKSDESGPALLALLGKDNWSGFASVGEAGKAIKAAADAKKTTAAQPAEATKPVGEIVEATSPQAGEQHEIIVNGATYNGRMIVFQTPVLQHGKLIMFSRNELAGMTGEPFATDSKVREWTGAEDKPQVYRFDTLKLTYEITKNGAPKVIKAEPEIPF